MTDDQLIYLGVLVWFQVGRAAGIAGGFAAFACLVLAIGQGDPITRVSESTFRKSFRFLLAVVAIGIALAATSPNQEFVQKLEAQAFPEAHLPKDQS